MAPEHRQHFLHLTLIMEKSDFQSGSCYGAEEDERCFIDTLLKYLSRLKADTYVSVNSGPKRKPSAILNNVTGQKTKKTSAQLKY